MGRGAAVQTEHNNFGVRDVVSPGHLIAATGKLSAHLQVTPGLHLYVHYCSPQKELLRKAFVMEAMEVPTRSLFVCYGYVQHSGSEWPGENCSRYHSYLILENYDVTNAVSLAYEGVNALGAEKHSLPVKEGLHQQMGHCDEQPCLIHGCRRLSKSEGSDSELSTSVPETRTIFDDD